MSSSDAPSSNTSLTQRVLSALGIKNVPKHLQLRTNNNQVRMLVELGSQDEWSSFTVDRTEFSLPKDITKVRLCRYDFTLVLRTNTTGGLSSVPPAPERLLDLGYPIQYFAYRPRTLLTEDGRIYFDQTLDQNILHSYLDTLREQYCGPHRKDMFTPQAQLPAGND